MTAAVFRNTPAIPQSQNTAPVLEFNCLYTHDIRKKSKKWQDGFLRYHTFNKRAMIYDVPRNLIGDTHWTGDEAVQEGDELTLERNGVMVEVGESRGQTETDLTELRKSRKKDQSDSRAATPAGTKPGPASRPLNISVSAGRAITQQKHKSLNAQLGTPKGPIGKAALPAKSPFEERHADIENEEWEEGRPPKRARVGIAPPWNVTRTTTTPKAVTQNQQPLWARTVDAAKQRKKAPLQPGQQRLGTREVIDLADDEEPKQDFLPGFSDSALAPSSPAKTTSKPAPKPAPKQKPTVRSSSPAFQTQRPSKPRDKQLIDVDAEPVRRLSNSSSTTSKVIFKSTSQRDTSKSSAKAKRRLESDSSETMRESPDPPKLPSPRASRPASSRPGQMLRLAASAPKKKTLLCQDQLKKKPKRISSTNTDEMAGTLVDAFIDEEREERPKTDRERLKERLARIDKKQGSTSSAKLNTPTAKPPPIELESDGDETPAVHQDRLRTSHETSAIELGRLDAMMFPPAVRPVSRQKSPTPDPEPPAPARQEERPFRRAISDTVTTQSGKAKSRRASGAPVRYTPTPPPTKKSRQPTPSAASRPTSKAGPQPQESVLQPSTTRNTSKKKGPLQKSVSLNVTANGTSTVLLSKPFQAPGKSKAAKEPERPKDLGPWSREAFDLFTWRPPNWDEEKWCKKNGDDNGNEASNPPAGLSGGVSFPRS